MLSLLILRWVVDLPALSSPPSSELSPNMGIGQGDATKTSSFIFVVLLQFRVITAFIKMIYILLL